MGGEHRQGQALAVALVPHRGPCMWVCRGIELALRGGQGPGRVGMRRVGRFLEQVTHPSIRPSIHPSNGP